MGKTKSPLLSLEAHGTVGDALTYQGRGSRKIVRAKPRIIDRLTWPRVYHRWDYVDFAYLWHQLSDAEKASWRIDGTLRGISAFNAFMRETLLDKDSILARYHLDEGTGNAAEDSGPNSLHGVVTGALPVSGRFAGARWFDGIDDHVNCGNNPVFAVTDFLNVECWIKATLNFVPGSNIVVAKDSPGQRAWVCLLTAAGFPRMFLGGIGSGVGTIAITSDKWTHVVWQWRSGAHYQFWVNGQDAGQVFTPASIPSTTSNVWIAGRDWPASELHIKATIDEVVITNRILDPTEILVHAQRRSPL